MCHFARINYLAHLLTSLSLLLSLPLVSVAQFQWAHQIGSAGDDVAEKHVVDSNGDIVVTGYFENSVSIGGFELASMDKSDIFIYKTKPDGNVIWAKSFEGPVYGGDVGVDTDAEGNIYVAGGFINELYFNGALQLTAIPNNHYWNSFLAKLDRDGNMIWIKGILGTTELSEVRVWGLVSVSKSGIALAGNFGTSVKIDNQVLSNPVGFPGSNLFVAKFDLNGNLAWIKNPPSETNVECRKISLEDSGDIYITGPFTNTVHFDSFTITATNNTHSDIYLTKLNSDGVTQWAKTGLKMADREDNNLGQSFTIDPYGNIYLVGRLKGDVKFDHIILQGNTAADYWATDSFIVKYNENGELLQGALFGEEFDAFLTDIEYSSSGIFLLGMSRSSSQFFQSILNTEQLTGQTTLLQGHGIPLHITVSPYDASIFISGQMSFLTTTQNELITKGGNGDGFLARIAACKNSSPPSVPDLVGPRELCLNAKITYAFPAVENATHYVWEIPTFLNPQGDINSDMISIDLNVTSSGTGVVSVYAVDECGQKGNKVTLQVHAYRIPEKPLLEKTECDTEIFVNNGENVEWYKDNELISDENRTALTVSDSGSYHVINRNYCGISKSEVISLNPISPHNIFFSNVITPNGDGKNDFFQIDSSILNSELKIFDRWGMEVFQKQPYDNSWNAVNLSGGIYYYSVRNRCVTNLLTGWIQVIKGSE